MPWCKTTDGVGVAVTFFEHWNGSRIIEALNILSRDFLFLGRAPRTSSLPKQRIQQHTKQAEREISQHEQAE